MATKTKTKKVNSIMISEILKKIAPSIGAIVNMEPIWGRVGQIVFKNGKKSYFRGTNLGINPLGASEIAKDKDFANYFMKLMGYPTIEGKTFFSNKWCKAIGSNQNIVAACKYAEKLGFPIIVKPNSGSQGSGVAKVYDIISLRRALKRIFKIDRVAIVQRLVVGNDYRIVIMDNHLVSAYQRIPLSVIGDGHLSISQLLDQKMKNFIDLGRDTIINSDDPRIKEKLAEKKMNLKSVPLAGEKIYLLDNANLSTGGDAIDVTNSIHPKFREFAIKLTRDMGLRLCGVDLMIDGDISREPGKFWILEINAAPGLDHYAKSGVKQQHSVEQMYLKVLKAIEKIK